MKKFVLVAALACVACTHEAGITSTPLASDAMAVGSTKAETVSIDVDLTAQRLSPDVWLVQDRSFYDTNVLIAKMPGDTVIIASSFIDSVKTEKLVDWIKKSLRPKAIRAINTHFHFDGTGGNEAYHREGVETWSTQQTQDLYKGRADSMRSSLAESLKGDHAKALKATKNSLAKHSFHRDSGLEWDFQGEKVIVYYPGPAHSPDNLVVYLPAKKILFGGCMVRALDYDLGNTNDADLKNYHKSALALRQFPADIVIPGHGTKGGMDLVEHTIALASKAQK